MIATREGLTSDSLRDLFWQSAAERGLAKEKNGCFYKEDDGFSLHVHFSPVYAQGNLRFNCALSIDWKEGRKAREVLLPTVHSLTPVWKHPLWAYDPVLGMLDARYSEAEYTIEEAVKLVLDEVDRLRPRSKLSYHVWRSTDISEPCSACRPLDCVNLPLLALKLYPREVRDALASPLYLAALKQHSIDKAQKDRAKALIMTFLKSHPNGSWNDFVPFLAKSCG